MSTASLFLLFFSPFPDLVPPPTENFWVANTGTYMVASTGAYLVFNQPEGEKKND